jgi:hypothetical protein
MGIYSVESVGVEYAGYGDIAAKTYADKCALAIPVSCRSCGNKTDEPILCVLTHSCGGLQLVILYK